MPEETEQASQAAKDKATEAAKEKATEAAKEKATEAAKDKTTEAAKEKAKEAAKEKLATNNEARAKQHAEMEKRGNWKPTPTTEELNLVALGVDIDTVGLKEDGSGPDPHEENRRAQWPGHATKTRDMKPARSDRGYETR
jgi:hypothetical protein